jgi:hypothetical protein
VISVGIESYQTVAENSGQIFHFDLPGQVGKWKNGPEVRNIGHHVHAGMSYGSSRSHSLSAISDEDYASHANRAVMGDASYPEAGSKSTATKFRAVLMSLLGLDLPVVVVRGPDTTVPHSSDSLHLKVVSEQIKLV